jgi:putative transposase
VDRTFFISASSGGRRNIFQSARMQILFLDVLRHYRREDKFLLHAFVMMPDHIHLLITPAAEMALEQCMQLIKGGFSYRARTELQIRGYIWTPGFNKHRITSRSDYEQHVEYIHHNPVKRGLVTRPEEYECSSAWPGRKVDPAPFAAGAKALAKRAGHSPG